MTFHTAEVRWLRGDETFSDNRYSRAHEWRFDGGAVVAASSSPHVVRVPLSDASAVDPEEAFLAALSSCHMLWFLGLAAADGLVIDSYEDNPKGELTKDGDGREWLAEFLLAPRITVSGQRVPTDRTIADLHHRAHEACFLARSVRSKIMIEGSWERAAA